MPTLFSNSIFINCPFDDGYKILLRPLLFTVVYCGLSPKICETNDSEQSRVDNIKKLIASSKYCIHDLSRMDEGNEIRFNMPFELGLDLGCKSFGNKIQQTKKCLIFEKEQYRIKKVLSDLSGNDICFHNDDPKELLFQLRNWLRINLSSKISGSEKIWNEYCYVFVPYFKAAAKKEGHSKDGIDKMMNSEFISYIHEWIKNKKIL